jgi:hypothetical protein
MNELSKGIAQAVRLFWLTRSQQDRKQGSRTGLRDAGNRTAATGGKQLDGFNNLVYELLLDAGISDATIYRKGRAGVTLPGFFRPTKQWDLVVVAHDSLLAAIELKALCGPSFGNNYNNRVEEALGSSTDIWTAYREGAFESSPRPFVGYLLLLEEAVGSTRTVGVSEKHFDVFPEFRDASYAKRCEESLRKLVRERCYDAACLILSDRKAGTRGRYSEPAVDLSFDRFARLLCGMVGATYATIKDSSS